MKSKIYVNISPGIRIQDLADELAAAKNWGYDGVELSLDAFPIIISGRTNKVFVSLLKGILKDHDLSFSAHIGTGLDLRSRETLAMHINVLEASIDICAELGLDPLVLHFENDSGDPGIEEQFIRCHAQAVEYASQRKVTLGLENIEIEHYKPVLDAIRLINKPNFKLVLDTGHLYLAAKYYGFSFEDAVKECIPYVSHCHLSDNTGVFEQMRIDNFDLYRTLPMGYRIAYGRGDIHMPPLYCDVPFPFIIEELKKADFSGIYVCEYQYRIFEPFNAEICKNVRKLIES